MMENGRGLIKALENWAKKVTNGYQDVEVRDLSTSFRDGMAFCAIVHHYRPDLIDFASLSKENIFENNSLAFSVAEKQLGVPALLDAEDMVKYEKPDRLSIITYLSQLRNCFENQNKVKSKTDFKRIQPPVSGPPAKVKVLGPALLTTKRHEVCQVCKHRVFILERLIVDGKLYHTTCFRCHKCNSLLNPGAYVESDTEGVYECSVCLVDEAPETPKPAPRRSLLQNTSEIKIQSPETVPIKERKINTADIVNFAQSTASSEFSDTSEKLNSASDNEKNLLPLSSTAENTSKSGISVRDKIHAFEKFQPSEANVDTSPVSSVKQKIDFLKPKSPSESLVVSQSPDLSNDNNVKCSLNTILPSQNSTPLDSPQKLPFLNLGSSESSVVPQSFDLSNDNNVKSSVNTALPPQNSTSPDSPQYETEHSKHEIEKTNHNVEDSVKLSKSLLQVNNRTQYSSSVDRNDTNAYDKSLQLTKSPLVTSPKITRDIFKTSLQPLKLPSTIRRESPLTLGRTLEIPSLKSPFTTPSLRKNYSFNEQLPKSLVTELDLNSEKNVDLPIEKAKRRKSLESNSESNAPKELPPKNLSPIESSECYGQYKPKNNSSLFQTKLSSDDNIESVHKDDRKSLVNDVPTNTSEIDINTTLACAKRSDIPKNIFDEKSSLVIESKLISRSENESSEKFNSVTKTENHNIPALKPQISQKIITEEEYPDDLNPFGDDDSGNGKDEIEYPDDLNPFGDDDEINVSLNSETQYDESKNPFASGEDDDDETVNESPAPPKYSSPEGPSPAPFDSLGSNVSSPSSSLKGTLKKRPAPKPPALNEIFPKDSNLDAANKPSEKRTPTPRKNKPAPPPPMDASASPKLSRETKNEKPKPKEVKRKKRPAPPVPIPMRQDMKKIPLKEILQEMKEIEEKQREYEQQGREIEILIRDRDKDDEASVEEEEYIMQLFELVNQKNALFRRQAELMYIKRSQRLEEQQCKIEKEIRLLMEKPDSEKTAEDREKENELTLELIDIVDQRNSIIDSIEMDRRRELEEDHSVKEQIEIKNGDLPVTAEIEEQKKKKKAEKKKKKEKKKEKEKKKHEDQESGKGTLKKNKLFTRKS